MKSRNCKSGMSLVEVLVAITLLSLGLLAYVTTIHSTNGLVRRGDYTATATRTAADMIANFQANNVSLLPNGNTTQSLSDLPGGTAQVTIAPYNNNPAEHFMKQISVVVSWAGSPGMEQAGGTVRMSTYVSARK